ncbi:MAG: hypothetical protein K2Y71_16620 [Xanthobacteraceae bacterium]|nr:hypothetical protein [Xanthobacteraceae bacterium]
MPPELSLAREATLTASRLTLERARVRVSARWTVVGIVALILIPALALTGWLAVWLARSERLQLEKSAIAQSREVLAAIDREIVNKQNLLTLLAGSPFLEPERVKDFYGQAADLTRKVGLNIFLRDIEADEQVFNTAFPWGTALEGTLPAPRIPLTWKRCGQAGPTSPVSSPRDRSAGILLQRSCRYSWTASCATPSRRGCRSRTLPTFCAVCTSSPTTL